MTEPSNVVEGRFGGPPTGTPLAIDTTEEVPEFSISQSDMLGLAQAMLFEARALPMDTEAQQHHMDGYLAACGRLLELSTTMPKVDLLGQVEQMRRELDEAQATEPVTAGWFVWRPTQGHAPHLTSPDCEARPWVYSSREHAAASSAIPGVKLYRVVEAD